MVALRRFNTDEDIVEEGWGWPESRCGRGGFSGDGSLLQRRSLMQLLGENILKVKRDFSTSFRAVADIGIGGIYSDTSMQLNRGFWCFWGDLVFPVGYESGYYGGGSHSHVAEIITRDLDTYNVLIYGFGAGRERDNFWRGDDNEKVSNINI